MDVSSSSRPFPLPHSSLNAGLQVASKEISIKPAKQKDSDIELQVCDSYLFTWIMNDIYINSTSTYPSDHISACSCSFGSMEPTVEPTAVFLFLEEFFLPGIVQGNPTKFD